MKLVSVYPPYLGAGVRVTYPKDDAHRIVVRMGLHWWNKNLFGTQFGGSLYSMCDPHFVFILMKKLGPGYIVWNKSSQIEFLRPGRDFESRYLEATAYHRLGLHIAAVTGTDSHGEKSLEHASVNLHRSWLVSRVLAFLRPPRPAIERPELDAATLVLAPSASATDVLAAIRARRTIATFRFPAQPLACPHLGQVVRSQHAIVALRLSRPVARIVLYREGDPVRVWRDAESVEFEEELRRPAAYVFGATDDSSGENGRLLTSAIWYEPPTEAPPAPASSTPSAAVP